MTEIMLESFSVSFIVHEHDPFSVMEGCCPGCSIVHPQVISKLHMKLAFCPQSIEPFDSIR